MPLAAPASGNAARYKLWTHSQSAGYFGVLALAFEHPGGSADVAGLLGTKSSPIDRDASLYGQRQVSVVPIDLVDSRPKVLRSPLGTREAKRGLDYPSV
jgi:hypothetical protein